MFCPKKDKIDLNNNEFGKALRQKYPNEKEVYKQARQVVNGSQGQENRNKWRFSYGFSVRADVKAL